MTPLLLTPEECFLFVKHATVRLQQLATSTREDSQSDPHTTSTSKEAAKFIKVLLFLDHAVDSALCSYAESRMQARDGLREALMKAVSRSFSAAGLQDAHDAAAAAAAAQAITAARRMQLSHELQAMQALLVPGSPSHSQCCNADQLGQLTHAVSRLRSLEVDVELHARTAEEVRAQVASSDYSDVNFAYGSTPYSSWHQMLHHPAVSSAAAAAMATASTSESDPHVLHAHAQRICMVWGSSLGWLVFYSALTLGWRCVGYELLGSLHACAQDLAGELGLAEEVTFVHADLLSSRLSGVGVLVLTDQCWDQDLMNKAARKIHEELPEGSVVLAYRPWWGEARRGACALQPLAQLPVPVSWNDGARMYAFVRRPLEGPSSSGPPEVGAAPEPAARCRAL